MLGPFPAGLFSVKAVSAEEQPQIFRLRFTPLKMTTMFLFPSELDARALPGWALLSESCFCRRTTADLSTPFHSAQDDNYVSVSERAGCSGPSRLGSSRRKLFLPKNNRRSFDSVSLRSR